MDGKGNLYGTPYSAGAFTCGTIFVVTPAGEEFTLHTFGAPPLNADDGCGSMGNLTWDIRGNLYGTTNACGTLDGGVVFEMSPPQAKGSAWTYGVLLNFDGNNGGASSPEASLILDKNGNLYGSTDLGGLDGNGAVFEVVP